MLKFKESNGLYKHDTKDGKTFIYRKIGKRWQLIINVFELSVVLSLKTEQACKMVATLLSK